MASKGLQSRLQQTRNWKELAKFELTIDTKGRWRWIVRAKCRGREGCCCSCLLACNSRLLLGVWCLVFLFEGWGWVVANGSLTRGQKEWNVAPPGLPHGLLFVMSRFWMEWGYSNFGSQCHFLGFWCWVSGEISGHKLVKATSHMSQEPWPCNGEDPWLSSKGRTMGVGKAVLCSHGPSSIVWSENGPCCRTIAYFVGRSKRGGFGSI